MDKYDFIKRLDNALSPLSETERESALRYYKELFEDAENESELIEHLGSPEKIAENIIRESFNRSITILIILYILIL